MEEQYKKECGNKCGCVLTINTPVMCWNRDDMEITLCNECYWDAGYWKDDQNEDNKDEIEEFKSQYEELFDLEDVVFCCEGCNRAIIRYSKEHDNCNTRDGEIWYCMDCELPSEKEAESDEEEE